MNNLINIYCDESCHLENDKQKVMVIGAIWCPVNRTREANVRIRDLKRKHNLNKNFEIKWTKVSQSKIDFYLDVIDYFFDDDHLHYRAIVVPDKSALSHDVYNQTHDEFYYKMYFDMLKVIIDPDCHYKIYIDIKDTKGGSKTRKLHDVLANAHYDFQRSIIEKIQIVKSYEIELIQVADLITGAISYVNRGLTSNKGKNDIVNRIRKRSKYSLLRTTLYKENKVNIFIWNPKINL